MPVVIPVTPSASVMVAAPAIMIPPALVTVPSTRPCGRGKRECCSDCGDPE
jgi:hypothetical protein